MEENYSWVFEDALEKGFYIWTINRNSTMTTNVIKTALLMVCTEHFAKGYAEAIFKFTGSRYNPVPAPKIEEKV